jgi:DNA-binding response OmpR family regulator
MGAEAPPPRGPARVLLLLDRPALAETIALALRHGRCATRLETTTAAAAVALAAWRPHLAVVDMDLAPDPFLARLGPPAAGDLRLPVIALTRRGDLATKLAAFERGVDDLLTVPFPPEELVARVLAVLRRAYRGAAAFTPTLRLGELEIDLLHRRVRAGETELHLTALELSLLYFLAANAGRVVSRDEILDYLWGADYAAGSNVVDRHVRNLRVKLQNGWRRPRYLATVPGKGYRFLATAADEPAGGGPSVNVR